MMQPWASAHGMRKEKTAEALQGRHPFCVSPLRGWVNVSELPWADAHGYELSPLRGW
jgi:hypothetical protein